MTEEEIMIRAREASIKFGALADTPEGVRNGSTDDAVRIRVAAIALRDLSKPLSEIQPVDPDLIEARKIAAGAIGTASYHGYSAEDFLAGRHDDKPAAVGAILKAIKRGRELERNQ